MLRYASDPSTIIGVMVVDVWCVQQDQANGVFFGSCSDSSKFEMLLGCESLSCSNKEIEPQESADKLDGKRRFGAYDGLKCCR